MTLIGVNKAELVTYASSAETTFGTLTTTLDALVSDCVSVNYWGENAFQFKTKASGAAVTMGTEIGAALKKFIGQVNSQTSAISKSLGGVDMSIDIAVKAVQQPQIPTSNAGESGADTAQLDALQETVNGHCSTIVGLVEAHQTALKATPNWVGNSKEAALRACSTFTSTVNTSVDTNLKKITGFITEQKTSVTTADAV